VRAHRPHGDVVLSGDDTENGRRYLERAQRWFETQPEQLDLGLAEVDEVRREEIRRFTTANEAWTTERADATALMSDTTGAIDLPYINFEGGKIGGTDSSDLTFLEDGTLELKMASTDVKKVRVDSSNGNPAISYGVIAQASGPGSGCISTDVRSENPNAPAKKILTITAAGCPKTAFVSSNPVNPPTVYVNTSPPWAADQVRSQSKKLQIIIQ